MPSDHRTLPFVELLGVDAGVFATTQETQATPVVFLVLRPEPNRSWRSVSLPVSVEQATRLRDDLTRVLKEFEPAQQLN